MSLERDLNACDAAYRALLDHLRSLRLTIVEDRPLDRDLALIDARSDALDELVGSSEEGLHAIARARSAASAPVDWPTLHRALLTAQERYEALWRRSYFDLLCHERVLELQEAARRYGGEWGPWSRSALDALAQCPRALHRVAATLLECWRGLLECHGARERGLWSEIQRVRAVDSPSMTESKQGETR